MAIKGTEDKRDKYERFMDMFVDLFSDERMALVLREYDAGSNELKDVKLDWLRSMVDNDGRLELAFTLLQPDDE